MVPRRISRQRDTLKIDVAEPLEIVGAVLGTISAIAVGVVFHRVALSVVLGLAFSAASIVYFAQVFEDTKVEVRVPSFRSKIRWPRRKRHLQLVTPVGPGGVVRHCGVCDDRLTDHTECNKVVRQSAATVRR